MEKRAAAHNAKPTVERGPKKPATLPKFSQGEHVAVQKVRKSVAGQPPAKDGPVFEGELLSDLVPGQVLALDSGMRAAQVLRVLNPRPGMQYIETKDGWYEAFLDLGEVDRGAQDHLRQLETKGKDGSPKPGDTVVQNEFGSVSVPSDMKVASLNDEVFDQTFAGERTYINKPALKGVLLESNGAEIFRAMGGRIFVVAKVGDMHLPFYISSSGTSGKKEGAWHPFFGYTREWIVKGGSQEVDDENGLMRYSPEINKIQDVLNENLILPHNKLSPRGKAGDGLRGFEPQRTLFDINDHFVYQNVMFTDYVKNNDDLDEADKQYVKRVTGYDPHKISGYNDVDVRAVDSFTEAVVSRIEAGAKSKQK